MTDPRLSSAAERRDLGAVVDAVSDRLAMPADPSGPLAVCARALVDRRLADEEAAPAVVRVVLESALKVARTCLDCGEIHDAWKCGEGLTWKHKVDGHPYKHVHLMAIHWLDNLLQEGA